MRKLIAVLAVALLSLAIVASAEAQLSTSAAERALAHELRSHYGIKYPTINCQKLTARKMHCRFHGLTNADVRDGHIEGHAGDAYVTKYAYGIDVRVLSFHG